MKKEKESLEKKISSIEEELFSLKQVIEQEKEQLDQLKGQEDVIRKQAEQLATLKTTLRTLKLQHQKTSQEIEVEYKESTQQLQTYLTNFENIVEQRNQKSRSLSLKLKELQSEKEKLEESLRKDTLREGELISQKTVWFLNQTRFEQIAIYMNLFPFDLFHPTFH